MQLEESIKGKKHTAADGLTPNSQQHHKPTTKENDNRTEPTGHDDIVHLATDAPPKSHLHKDNKPEAMSDLLKLTLVRTPTTVSP